jgi:hypothetical protein
MKRGGDLVRKLRLGLKGKDDITMYIEAAEVVNGMFYIKAISPERELYIPIEAIYEVEITGG